MDEQRKYAILFAATILAERIPAKIDERWSRSEKAATRGAAPDLQV